MFGLSGDSDFRGSMVAALNDPTSYRVNTGDTDFWKLMNDGTLLDDDRKSLYRETADGGEFRIWDLESLSEEESFNRLFTVNGETASFNEEALKRIGLYEILNNASNLTEENFAWIANSSFKMGDNLGYYVDFTLLKDDMKYLSNQILISKKGSITMPTDEMIFNARGLLNTAGVFGTLSMSAGLEFNVNDSPFYNEIQKMNVDNLPENIIAKAAASVKTSIPNPYGPQKGKPVNVMHTESPLQGQVPRYENSSNLANVATMLSQFTTGVQQGINVNSVGLPQWNFNGTKYFTIWEPKLTGGRKGAFDYTPQFSSWLDAITTKPIKKLDTYLGMPDGKAKTKFANKNNFWGW